MQQFLLLLNSKASQDITTEELERRLNEYKEWVKTIPLLQYFDIAVRPIVG